METLETYKKWKLDPLRYEEEINEDMLNPFYVPEGASHEVTMHNLRLLAARSAAMAALSVAQLNRQLRREHKTRMEYLKLKRGEA